ncbi:pilus assembly FimT family protein [Vulgatibacter incomptus]|uniref:Type IV fimbrial biogenesis protein FimT n=1 Tax=Vulgatibacter incomptus TaxID=1391653 RepID=A0A0K1PDW2_9BACT|nr:type II secretion system protein [Vulgatibacter incomptus]AKU91713.1 hypothetical protein AKJ08_2100 [Vulgatibacter incomptus]
MASRDHGFTLIELALVITIVGILLGVSTWAIQSTLPGYRAAGAAARFRGAVRSASAIAARTNRPVRLTVVTGGSGACASSYSIADVGAAGRVFDTACFETGILLGPNAIALGCQGEAALPACSLCAGGAITFLPSGEVQTSALTGDSLVFVPREGPTRNIRAVGVRSGLGMTRTYRREGNGWVCP